MTDVVFQREMLPLGEFLKINLDIRIEPVSYTHLTLPTNSRV